MKSRRLIASPKAYEYWFKLAQSKGCGGVQTQVGEWPTDVRFGSKADIALGPRHVRFTTKADIAERDRNVRFVPEADSCSAAKTRVIRSPRRRAPEAWVARQLQVPWRFSS